MLSSKIYKPGFFIIMLLTLYVSHAQVLTKKNLSNNLFNSVPEAKLDNIFDLDNQLFFSMIVGERYDKKTHSMHRNFTLLNQEGMIYNLQKNEYPLNLINGHLYTQVELVENNEKTYNIYKMAEGGLSKTASKTFSLNSSVEVLKNGKLIITEGGHSGRDWIGLYNKSFKEINKFKPFNDESHISYDSNDELIAYVGKIAEDQKIRVALYASFGNNGFLGSQELDIEPDYVLSSVKLVKDKLVILLSNIKSVKSFLIVIDKHFNVIQETTLNERISYNKVLAQDSTFFVNTTSKISSYNTARGATAKWSYIKNTNKPVKTKYGYRFTGSNIYNFNKDHLLLLEATYEDKKDLIQDVVLKVLDLTSNKNSILKEIKVSKSFTGDLKLKQFDNFLVVFGNNNFELYEK